MPLIRTALFLSCLAGMLLGCEGMFDRSGSQQHVDSAQPYSVPGDYTLGAGDVISVRVYGGDEDIRLERVRIDNFGTLVLPFGEFKARGSTTRQLEGAITNNVRGRLLKNPRVSVNVDEYRPFFVDGQVGRPGAYPYQPGLNVRKAVTIAGGFRDRASLQKIFVVREQDTANARVKVDLNASVGPGDTVLVEESFF